jgi:CubicO group peptidase (beta-lactamase class C family)
LLGRIVSKASGIPYAEYLAKNILVPLGMRSTTLEAATLPASLRATGYRLLQNEYFEEPSLPHGAFGSMGGLLTSALWPSAWLREPGFVNPEGRCHATPAVFCAALHRAPHDLPHVWPAGP